MLRQSTPQFSHQVRGFKSQTTAGTKLNRARHSRIKVERNWLFPLFPAFLCLIKVRPFYRRSFERRDRDNVPVSARFKLGHVRRRRPSDRTKGLQCEKFGVNAALATAKARIKQTEPGHFGFSLGW